MSQRRVKQGHPAGNPRRRRPLAPRPIDTAVTIISVLGVSVAVHLRLIYMLERER